MTDFVAEPIQDFEEQEVYELKKSQHSNLSVTPKKSQKSEADEQKPFEKENDNVAQYEEPRTQENTLIKEEQSLHYNDLVNDTQAHTQDQAEVQRELIELHVQIDKILGLYKAQAPGPYSYYLDEINHNGSFERITSQDFRLEELLRSPAEQVKSSYIERPTEHIQYESSYRSGPAEFQYQSSSYQQESFRPKYDKEKLDQIIRKILGGKSGYRALESLNFRNTNITHNNQVTLPRNYVNEAPKQSVNRYQETVKKAAPVAALKSRPHFCGECENDVDSLVEEHMGEAANEIKLKSNDHTNFYVGSLIDDEEEVPRVKKIDKRKEIQAVKKQANASNKEHKDFVLKGTYEKKSQEQNKAIEPHKFFDKNEEEIKDFVF